MSQPDDPDPKHFSRHAPNHGERFLGLVLIALVATALAVGLIARAATAQAGAADGAQGDPAATFETLVAPAPSLAIVWQDGARIERSIAPGWNHITGPLGVHLFAGDGRYCARLSNGVADAPGEVGTTFLARIELNTGVGSPVVIERAGWKLVGSTIVIGDGNECIPPRGSLRIRWARPGLSIVPEPPSEWVFRVGSLEVPLPDALATRDAWRVPRLLEALRTGKADPDGARLHTPALGMWHPRGDPYCAVGGAHGIEPIAGWERSWHLSVLASDLTMERMPLDALRASDGEPVEPAAMDAANYTLVRGWSKSGQLQRFARAASASPYDDSRVPAAWNLGTCPYYAAIHGIDRYSQYLPHDGQHLVRGVHEADAGAQLWRDACCAFDLRVIAADVRLAYRKLPSVAPGQGSAWYGRREPAWAAWALLAAAEKARVRLLRRLSPEFRTLEEAADALEAAAGVLRPSADRGALEKALTTIRGEMSAFSVPDGSPAAPHSEGEAAP